MNKILYILVAILLLAGCAQKKPDSAVLVDELPTIFPNNMGVTVPFNIAPLNFKFIDEADELYVELEGRNSQLAKFFKSNKTNWEVSEWTKFLEENKGDSIGLTIFAKTGDMWREYRSFSYYVSTDPLDEYLMYRLISPGYQTWNKMGIYQRQMSSFKEKTLLDNQIMPHSCMNCHTLSAHDPDNMVFHIRENKSGTFIIKDGELSKLEAKQDLPFKSVSFPSWHPTNKYIAFSINKVRQVFPAQGTERAHGFDVGSNMVIYDVDKEEYKLSPVLYREDSFDAYPCFSPDGKSLYFISAPAAPMPKELRNIQYSLCRVDFDAFNGTVGEKVDTLITPAQTGKSLTMPRISPDGKHILLTFSDYGNFPAYNEEADLYLYSVVDSTLIQAKEWNSDQVESYHSWSSTGKWVVFSSRRMDGLFMHAYLAHFDAWGKMGKPFLLPQKDPDFYQSSLFSFNLPEFSVKPMSVSPREITKLASKVEKQVNSMEATTH